MKLVFLYYLIFNSFLDERVSVLDVSRDKVIHLKTTGLQKTKGASSFTINVKVNYFNLINYMCITHIIYLINTNKLLKDIYRLLMDCKVIPVTQ